jgi:aromatic ring-opening dioxygenase catalytic subunit (LigB family)
MQPTFFIPHGAGPCFFMEWSPPDAWDTLAHWLRTWPQSLPEKPKALLVISGHWLEGTVSITTHPSPPLLYDYSGFPPHTYQLTWPAAGSPALAARVQTLLTHAGIESRLDPKRGYDHGVFIPLKLAFPTADIPTLQLSLQQDLDPSFHLRLGKALAPLRAEGVLIIGSGMSYHNMRRYNRDNTPISGPEPQAFDNWLTHTITHDAEKRSHYLARWQQAPGATDAHPPLHEEHLLPLMVAAGASDAPGSLCFTDRILGAPISAYSFA